MSGLARLTVGSVSWEKLLDHILRNQSLVDRSSLSARNLSDSIDRRKKSGSSLVLLGSWLGVWILPDLRSVSSEREPQSNTVR